MPRAQRCPGANLYGVLRRAGRLPEAAVLRVVGQLARALGHIHAAGLVYVDLKPEQVMWQVGRRLPFGGGGVLCVLRAVGRRCNAGRLREGGKGGGLMGRRWGRAQAQAQAQTLAVLSVGFRG